MVTVQKGLGVEGMLLDKDPELCPFLLTFPLLSKGGNSHLGTLGPPWSACPLPAPVPVRGLRKTISYIDHPLQCISDALIHALTNVFPNPHNSGENRYPHIAGKETEAQRDA